MNLQEVLVSTIREDFAYLNDQAATMTSLCHKLTSERVELVEQLQELHTLLVQQCDALQEDSVDLKEIADGLDAAVHIIEEVLDV